jgi:hypothetical protein
MRSARRRDSSSDKITPDKTIVWGDCGTSHTGKENGKCQLSESRVSHWLTCGLVESPGRKRRAPETEHSRIGVKPPGKTIRAIVVMRFAMGANHVVLQRFEKVAPWATFLTVSAPAKLRVVLARDRPRDSRQQQHVWLIETVRHT